MKDKSVIFTHGLTNLNLYYNGIGGAGATSITEAKGQSQQDANQSGFV